MYAEEKASTHALKKELASYQRQISDAKLAREDAKQVRRKLEQMQAIENLIKGEEEGVDPGSGQGLTPLSAEGTQTESSGKMEKNLGGQ